MKSNCLVAAATAAALMFAASTDVRAQERVESPRSTGSSVLAKVEGAVERGAKATARGVERGAKAAQHGIKVGLQAAARGDERGAKATARVADSVAKKVGASTGSDSDAGP